MLKKVICPSCGKELDIPSELQSYACLYCGARTELPQQPVPSTEYETLRQGLQSELIVPITGYGSYYQKITRREFFSAFASYEEENAPLFQRIDACICAHPAGIEAGSAELAEDFMNLLEAYFHSSGRWEKHRNRESLLFEMRVLFAVFLTPAIQHQKLYSGERFRTALHTAWLKRYPKQIWTPGDYETLANGFKKRKLCYITTAVCSHEGKPDDCAELTAFRAFRDGYLTARGDGALIEEYYETAPTLVTCMTLCDDAQQRFSELRERWLMPCYQALQRGDEADCRRRYIAMVHWLQKKYLRQ